MVIFIIYVIGVVASYLMLKKFWVLDSGEWTISARAFVIVVSILSSWIGFLDGLFCIAIAVGFKNDKPASW